jgi:hypothetical protein
MDNFKAFSEWSHFLAKESDTAVKIMAETMSASTTILNTMATFSAKMFHQVKALQESRQHFFKSFAPYL